MSCCKCSLFTFVLRTCYVFLLNFFNLCDFVPFILLVPQFFPPHHSTEPPGVGSWFLPELPLPAAGCVALGAETHTLWSQRAWHLPGPQKAEH